MADLFTAALRDWGMGWKEFSLEIMTCGSKCTEVITVEIGSRRVPFKRAEQLNVLGFSAPRVFGPQHHDVSERMQCARRAFYAQ
eukprot:2354973-Pyramimonas_sp.AAC.1